MDLTGFVDPAMAPTPSSGTQADIPGEIAAIENERRRVQAAYRRRREWEAHSDLYAPWNPASILATAQRKRIAALMLKQAGAFPMRGQQCLEVGSGSRGWLADLVDWGLREVDLHGIDLDPARIQDARDTLPCADLRAGDATTLPWGDNTFALVVASTLFSSILDTRVHVRIAREITRVLRPGGALLWYDLKVNNPLNRDVRKVTRHQLQQLFPDLAGRIQSCTLAPPLARLVVSHRNWSWPLASFLEAIPPLRSHLLAVLIKETSNGGGCSVDVGRIEGASGD